MLLLEDTEQGIFQIDQLFVGLPRDRNSLALASGRVLFDEALDIIVINVICAQTLVQRVMYSKVRVSSD